MTDMQMHLNKLRNDAAECAMRAAETDGKERSDRFAMAAHHLSSLADQVERALWGSSEAEPRQIAQEYADDQREIMKKLWQSRAATLLAKPHGALLQGTINGSMRPVG